jgi:hypothetical protein
LAQVWRTQEDRRLVAVSVAHSLHIKDEFVNPAFRPKTSTARHQRTSRAAAHAATAELGDFKAWHQRLVEKQNVLEQREAQAACDIQRINQKHVSRSYRGRG